MAKYVEVSEETTKLVNTIANQTGLDKVLKIRVAGVPSSKKLIEIKMCPSLGEFVADVTDVLCVIVYEQAFERLTTAQQEMLMRDAFNTVYYDSEKDKVVIGCPQIVVSLDGRAKWGDELINAAETSLHVMQEIIEEKAEEKERQKIIKQSNGAVKFVD